MQKKNLIIPNHLFEVSWEVCNKVGGIHTVMASKIDSIANIMKGTHIVVGPYLGQGSELSSEFREDTSLLQDWRETAAEEGLTVRIGRWNVSDKPIAILVDFSAFFDQKEAIFGKLWNKYQLDSMTGEWDYIEPALFGYATGMVIDSYVKHNCKKSDKIVAQFHEWMTGTGLLYLDSHAPHIATAFTTHATALGRSIAGNNLPLYDKLTTYNPEDMARRFNIRAKQSLEKCSAIYADAYTTVSEITAQECRQFHGKAVDLVTPNGFQNFIKNDKDFEKKQKAGRKALVDVAEGILGHSIKKDALLIGTSGRYEFKNKGIDVFIKALAKLNNDETLNKDIVAFILVPAGHHGPIPELIANLKDKVNAKPLANPYLSHALNDEWNDPSLSMARATKLYNRAEDKVKLIFVPSYLNGNDGIFDVPYYDLLAGLDLSLFPSYYEPWGYTPLESVAFKVPTITTTLAGFGRWVKSGYKGERPGITVIERTDHNDTGVINAMSSEVLRHVNYSAAERLKARDNAFEISKIALWDNLVHFYFEAYSGALGKVEVRTETNKLTPILTTLEMQQNSTPNWHSIIIHRNIPEKLKGLEDISQNLWWCWNQEAMDLFKSIDVDAWKESEKNPIACLDLVTLDRFNELEKDKKFMSNLQKVHTMFKDYMAKKAKLTGPKISYFCMEFGLHTSLKIYSGGLGVLAGDFLKEASDKEVRMSGVGFLYRYGYFTQRLSTWGDQENVYDAQFFDKMPVTPLRDKNDKWVTVSVDFPGRKVAARVWLTEVGRVNLYLLDTDFEDNLPEDRPISHQLYGGDWENRLKQEILLGIGGIRVLEALGIETDVYHCNEGHAAFIGFERISNLIDRQGLTFDEALEVVRSSSLFTTHTPVPAGHDAFNEGMLRKYMHFMPDRFNISWERFVGLGRVHANDSNERFSMSNLALRLSQETNGVSWLHGEVSRQMFQNIYPGYLPEEIPIGFVTNGVHHPTWTATEWKDLILEINGGDMTSNKYSTDSFAAIQNVDDKRIWEIRKKLRARLVEHIKERVSSSGLLYYTPREIVEIMDTLSPDKLTIGFARRFATYKRADLLFRNLDTLNSIINDPERPVQFIFAGKAHPADQGGKDLIKRIVEVSKYPQFLGKIIFIENYDMEVAYNMIQGVDVWLNTPTRPLEASGTSGCKGVMNGVMHFSVLDGWWVEGYKKGAGWMLPIEQEYEDNNFQNELDAERVYHAIENDIAPQFYTRGKDGVPTAWIQTVKNCIEFVASEFTMNRMMVDYEERFYNKLDKRHKEIKKKDYAMAKDLVQWKNKVRKVWDNVKVLTYASFDIQAHNIVIGEEYTLEATIDCAGLEPKEIGVELMIMLKKMKDGKMTDMLEKFNLEYVSINGTIATYQLKHKLSTPGTYSTGIRVYPTNKLLAHQTELCLVKWI